MGRNSKKQNNQGRQKKVDKKIDKKIETPMWSDKYKTLYWTAEVAMKLRALADLSCDNGMEVSTYGILSEDKSTIIDLLQIKCEGSGAETVMDGTHVAELLEKYVDDGGDPALFGKVWLHTHPNMGVVPSSTDTSTMVGMVNTQGWAIMIISNGKIESCEIWSKVGPFIVRSSMELKLACPSAQAWAEETWKLNKPIQSTALAQQTAWGTSYNSWNNQFNARGSNHRTTEDIPGKYTVRSWFRGVERCVQYTGYCEGCKERRQLAMTRFKGSPEWFAYCWECCTKRLDREDKKEPYTALGLCDNCTTWGRVSEHTVVVQKVEVKLDLCAACIEKLKTEDLELELEDVLRMEGELEPAEDAINICSGCECEADDLWYASVDTKEGERSGVLCAKCMYALGLNVVDYEKVGISDDA